ncbi:MerR family transcriptional regulator [Melioribacter sp. OK-6-Me]|uniref:MerR family transcriptional regulator n=1 Tax=unclassified Melioribacter TaxID=2627329 RepID=UPI003EDA1EE6
MKDFGLKKLYYSISEVSKITGLEQYILRYWETEFEQLKPSKNRAGNRIYTNKDIKLILEIKKLLREEKYTIEGAKKILSGLNKSHEKDNFAVQNDAVTDTHEKRELKEDLETIKKFLIELKEKL